MSNLRNKYRVLLGALSQQDSGVWSGDIKLDRVKFYSGQSISANGNLQSTHLSYTYVLKIPKGANKITINSNISLNSAGVAAIGSGFCLNENDVLFTSRQYVGNVRTLARTIPDGVYYFGISTRQTDISLLNATFVFSK